MTDINGNGYGLIEKIAEGIWFKFVARAAMILAAAFLPVAGTVGLYTAKRILESNDRALEQLSQTITSVRLLQQQADDQRLIRDAQFDGLKAILDDHEGRIRILERVPKL
jgi:hypothetical protein